MTIIFQETSARFRATELKKSVVESDRSGSPSQKDENKDSTIKYEWLRQRIEKSLR